ncbi:hypothetical protein EG327_000233 [Venturia inaequalis]|uniref:Major facilitator superfamily (MFS) profile domain-containing protein n=1 Tax=Venturia inaequalis TaxID=5025 RepID=A0A8H3UAP1_VENIN|nr:hypothetical protein EG327_000233 [Venturia inaequalis]
MEKGCDAKLHEIPVSASDLDGEVAFDEKATKRLLRKIDIVLLPLLSLLYLLSFLDRANIGNARLAGLEKDLHLKGLIITTWYKREECGLRLAIFYSSATAAGAFGGILARGIMQMNGVGGKAGWSWIFIIEGLLTFVVALGAFYFMQDYPDTAGFLTKVERREVKRRLENDRDFLADEYNTKFIWQALTDWKVYVLAIASGCLALPTYCVSLFLPTIVKELGYKNTTAQLMSTPPYLVACFVCIAGGYAADRLKTRGPFMIGFTLVAMIGFLILLVSTNDHIKYAGCFFITSGLYPSVPQGMAWASCNTGGTLKRSIGIATFVMFGNMAGLSASFVFMPKFGPHYRVSHAALLATTSTALCLSIFMTIWVRRENARREAVKPRATYTDEEMRAQREMGDDAGFWRYTT